MILKPRRNIKTIAFIASAALVHLMMGRGIVVAAHPFESGQYVAEISDKHFGELLQRKDFFYCSTIVLINAGTTYTIPSDFSSFTSMQAWGGAGRGGYTQAGGTVGGSGGGGPAFAKITAFSGLAAGNVYDIQIGRNDSSATGSATSVTCNTWIKDTSGGGGSVALLAAGGSQAGQTSATASTKGVGGTAVNSTGSTKSDGGDGGQNSGGWTASGGGGGAGGPSGAGSAGAGPTSNAAGGNGGNGDNGNSTGGTHAAPGNNPSNNSTNTFVIGGSTYAPLGGAGGNDSSAGSASTANSSSGGQLAAGPGGGRGSGASGSQASATTVGNIIFTYVATISPGFFACF